MVDTDIENQQFRNPDPFAVYPAIDLLDGKCVRLYQGDFEENVVYNKDPVFVARKFELDGARHLHVVDLDGAKAGMPKQYELIKEIRSQTNILLQVGGGVRDMAAAENLFKIGVDRVIIGSALIKNPSFAAQMLKEFGAERVICGVDCRDGKVAIDGWMEKSKKSAKDLIEEFKTHGLTEVIYTDISRDGTLRGPNLADLKRFMDETQVGTVVSGGISCLEDVKELDALRATHPVKGVIVGKAIYTRKIHAPTLFTTIKPF